MKNIRKYLLLVVTIVALNACSRPDGDFGGSEYMPDMAHSIAQEANIYTYYEHNTWDEESTIKLKDLANLMDPVAGTVPRGYAGVAYASSDSMKNVMASHLSGMTTLNEISVPVNGAVPYYYEDTEDERNRAIAEIIDNPFPITDAGIARGKELYNVNCAICHGDKGDGVGFLVDDEKNKNVKYPAAPANFTMDAFVNSSNGRYYHAIMYGKNVMGSFSDKLSYEERWQVIHYIRSLQAKKAGAAYSQLENTLNPAYGTPAGLEHAEEEGHHAEDHDAHAAHGAEGEHGHSEGDNDESHGNDEHSSEGDSSNH